MGLLGTVREKLRANAIQRFMAQAARDNASFDRVYRTDTAGKFLLDDYDLSEEKKSGVEYYQVVHEGVLRGIIEAVAPNMADYEFLDVGCGKGKALLVASTYAFKRVRGVEISQKLTDVANQNINTFATTGPMRCTDVAAICQDAREVSGFGERTLVFMLNPFHDEPMQGFVPHLEKEASVPGRSMIVAYLTPHYRTALDAARSFTKLFDTNRLVIYATPGESISGEARDRLTRRFTTWQL